MANTTSALVERAEKAELARRYDRARTFYERAVREAPDPGSGAWAGRHFASALIQWGKDDEAERMLEKVVSLDPHEVSAWHDLGVLRARRGANAAAEQALRRSIELAPDDPRSQVALAGLLVNEHRYREALTMYRELEKLELPARVRRAIPRAIELLRAEIARQEARGGP